MNCACKVIRGMQIYGTPSPGYPRQKSVPDKIKFCPLHAASEELLGMLKVYRNELMERSTMKGDKGALQAFQLVDKAITEAEAR